MSNPTRLLHEQSDADALERALLESLSDAGPGEREKAAIWRDVSAGLLAGGVVCASAGAAASAPAGAASAELTAAGASFLPKALLVKVAVLVALSGAGASGVVLYQSRPEHVSSPRHAPKPVLSNATSTPPGAPELANDQAPREAVRAEPQLPDGCRGAHCKSKARPKPVSAAPPSDTLARENALLGEARSLLRRGDLAAAEAALGRITRAFPHGVLAQEREVLAIELLVLRDQSAAARERAARFIAAHPESPHSEKLERLLQ